MTISTKIFVAVLLFCSTAALAQNDFNGIVTGLQKVIAPVQTSSKNIEPKIEILQPGVLKYSFDETDQKGVKTNFVYEFNLADIDPYAVRELTQKDAIYSVLAVRNKQKLVKVYKNNEVQAYDLEVLIIANNIESARSINELVKKAIPLAEKIAESRLNITGYDAMLNWLTTHVKEVNLGTKTYGQTLTKGDYPGVVLLKLVETDSKGATENFYTINLADLDVHSLNFKIVGNNFTLVGETVQKAKYIAVKRNNEVKPYINEFSINTNNVDEARDLRTVLSKIIPLAVEKVKADLPVISSEKDGLQKIKTLTSNLNVNGKEVKQTMGDQCICSFAQIQQDSKSTTADNYQFNWMDFNPTASSIDVSGDKMLVELKTNNSNKMIMHSQNDKFMGYVNSISLYMSDVESARRTKAAIDKVIEKCSASYKPLFGSNASSWLLENTKDVSLEDETQSQSLEFAEAGNTNKLKYVRRTTNSKGAGSEEIFEFLLSDINPESIQSTVKGKWLYVSMETTYKNKIIKAYKDGKIQPYTSSLEIAVNDIELSRNMCDALKKSIAANKPKL